MNTTQQCFPVAESSQQSIWSFQGAAGKAQRLNAVTSDKSLKSLSLDHMRFQAGWATLFVARKYIMVPRATV